MRVELTLEFFEDLARQTLAEMPPEDRLSEADAAEILAQRALLASLEDALVAIFYDSLFSYPATRAIFRAGERLKREMTLRDWWRRTITGPFDLSYWAWQAAVGLVHVRRQVTNPMMLGHAALVARAVRQQPGVSPALADAIDKLMATVAALIANGYYRVSVGATTPRTGQSRQAG